MANVTENILLSNFVSTTLQSDINDSVLAMTVTSVDGMPTPGAGTDQYFYLVLQKVSAPAIREIVKCTNVNAGTKVLTIVRSQEGTDPLAWTAADTRVKLNITAATLEDIADEMTAVIDYVTYLDPSIDDQGDAAEVGSLAWHLADIGTSTHAQLIMRPGTYTVSTNITVPENITVKILPGALFDIDTDSRTLTFDGKIDAGAEPIRTLEAVPGNRLMVVNDQPGFVEWWTCESSGSANNHTALDSASRGCKHLIFSRGTYAIATAMSFQASTTTLEFTNWSDINASGVVTFTSQEIVAPFTAAPFAGGSANYTGPITNNPISGHWFGAVGDGTTDDTTAILNVITFAGSNSVIEFSNALTYLIKSVVFPSGSTNVTIAGGHFKRHDDGSGSIFEIDNTNDDCVFRDGIYEVPDSVIAADVSCIHIDSGAQGCRIYNNTFNGSTSTNPKYGQVRVDGASFCHIHDNHFIGTADAGSFISILYSGIYNVVTSNICEGKAKRAIVFNSGGTFSDNIIKMTSTEVHHGISIGENLYGTGGSMCAVSGNIFNVVAATEFRSAISLLGNASFVTVTGNVVNGGEGVKISSGASDITISGNTFDSTKTQIEDAGGTRISITAGSGVSLGEFMARYTAPEDTDGAAMTASTWTKVPLNEVATTLTAEWASLGSNQISVNAGTYDFSYHVLIDPAANNGHRMYRAKIADVTGAGDALVAGSESTTNHRYIADGHAHWSTETLTGAGRMVLGAVTNVLELQAITNATSAKIGTAATATFSGLQEVYAIIRLTRIT